MKIQFISWFICGITGVVTTHFGYGWFDGASGILINIIIITIVVTIAFYIDEALK